MDRELSNIIEAMPLPTEADRTRESLIGRLACALEDMSETLPADHPVRREAMDWKDREDFEHLLDVWEAGRYVGQRAAG